MVHCNHLTGKPGGEGYLQPRPVDMVALRKGTLKGCSVSRQSIRNFPSFAGGLILRFKASSPRLVRSWFPYPGWQRCTPFDHSPPPLARVQRARGACLSTPPASIPGLRTWQLQCQPNIIFTESGGHWDGTRGKDSARKGLVLAVGRNWTTAVGPAPRGASAYRYRARRGLPDAACMRPACCFSACWCLLCRKEFCRRHGASPNARQPGYHRRVAAATGSGPLSLSRCRQMGGSIYCRTAQSTGDVQIGHGSCRDGRDKTKSTHSSLGARSSRRDSCGSAIPHGRRCR